MSEEAVRGVIRRLAEAGDRAAALATYERLQERLAAELGMAPSRATRELADAVRAGEAAPASPAAEPRPQRPPPGPLPLPAGLLRSPRSRLAGRAEELA